MIGVQSNQYPRTMDIARPFAQGRRPVAIGGFHVSRLPGDAAGIQPDLQEAIDLGITLYAGELEAAATVCCVTPPTARCSRSTTI